MTITEIDKDYTNEAIELMRKADEGDAEAQYKFAIYLLKTPDFSYRKDLMPDEVERGMRYLQLSAAQGFYHGIAADIMGMIFFDGEIVPRDYKKAKLWFNTASMKGIPTSFYMLGECAFYGYDEEVNYEKAAKYYLQAAPRYINALIRLGDMYMQGIYLPLDPVFSRELYNHVRVSEDWLYKENNMYSSANEMALRRLSDLERADVACSSVPVNETEEQLTIRTTLMKIIEKDRKKWKKWSDDL